MRWRVLIFRSLYTVTLLTPDQSRQFDLPRIMASKPCSHLVAQLCGATDGIREEGTSGLGTDLGFASRAVAPHALTVTPFDKTGSHVGIQIVQAMVHLTPANKH